MKRKVFIVLALVAFMVLGVSGQALAASYPSWYRYFQYPWYGYQQPAKPAPKQPAPTQPAPTQPAPTQPAPTQPAGLSAEEQQMVNLVNQERAKAGLKPLAVDTRLVSLARLKSKDMIDKVLQPPVADVRLSLRHDEERYHLQDGRGEFGGSIGCDQKPPALDAECRAQEEHPEPVFHSHRDWHCEGQA